MIARRSEYTAGWSPRSLGRGASGGATRRERQGRQRELDGRSPDDLTLTSAGQPPWPLRSNAFRPSTTSTGRGGEWESRREGLTMATTGTKTARYEITD